MQVRECVSSWLVWPSLKWYYESTFLSVLSWGIEAVYVKTLLHCLVFIQCACLLQMILTRTIVPALTMSLCIVDIVFETSLWSLLWSKCEKRDDSILQPIKQLLFLPRVPFFPSLLSSFLPFTPPFSPSSRLIDSQTHCGTVRFQHRRGVFHSLWSHSPVNRQKWL